MLDLETWGNLPGCVFVSLGAVEFNRKTGQTGRTFYRTIDAQTALDAGLFVQADTINWWLRQSDAARAAILKDNLPLQQVLEEFTAWFDKSQTIWGNGLGFDVSILKMGYNAIKQKHPWKFDAERDVRTIVAEYPSIKKETKFNGVRHDPIADDFHQIQYLSDTIKKILKDELLCS